MNNFKLLVAEDGSPAIENNKLIIWDVNELLSGEQPALNTENENLQSRQLTDIPGEKSEIPASEREMLSGEQLTIKSENNLESRQLINISGKKSAASWKDDYAVKTLIEEWKGHESYFKNTTIINKKVWEMIASKLKKENPSWEYTGQQCEDKFKDLRKNYVRVKNHNEKSSGLQATCKFYKEMDDALGDKLTVKPVSIASTLKKHHVPCTQDSSRSTSVLGSGSESDNEHGYDSCPKSKKRKKSVSEKNIERLLIMKAENSMKKEEARQKRHTERMERQDRAIEVYRSTMDRLLEKL